MLFDLRTRSTQVGMAGLFTAFMLLWSSSSSKQAAAFTPALSGRRSGVGVCLETSAYVHQRARNATEPECRTWLAGPPVDAFTSQFGQDAFLFYNYFRCLDGPGTYLDIGAFHPRTISNTWFLDKCLGWRGICAEGNAEQAAVFRTTRSCHVIDKVVSFESATTSFLRSSSGGHIVTEGSASAGTLSPTITIEDALAETDWARLAVGETTRIDFLSLDVEEHELEVLLAVPWDRVDVRFAAVENNRNFLDVWEFLMRIGFVKVATISVDEIFMRLERAAPLWLPSGNSKQTASDNTYRRDSYKAPCYLHEPLYSKGWDYVLAYVRKHHALPGPETRRALLNSSQ